MPDRLINPTAAPGSYRQIAITVVSAALIGYGSAWFQSRTDQDRQQYNIEQMQQNLLKQSQVAEESARQREQMAIRLAEMGVIQNNLLEQMRDVKRDHEELKRRRGE
jgi:hypothetical protein